jgi:hypothetical protein
MLSKKTKFNILLYCNRPQESQNAGTIVDHIDAFQKYSQNNIFVWSSMNGLPDNNIMRRMDCIIIHYTLSLLYETYIPQESLQRIRDFKGLKILFIQDEYRRVNFVCQKIDQIGVDAIFTCAPLKVAEKIYRSISKKTKILSTLTGYVPEGLSKIVQVPLAEREIDVGYRARKCSFYLGRKSHEKYEIGNRFLAYSRNSGLRCNISSLEKDRLYGSDWIDFVSNCKTNLGTESGASLIDFTGKLEYELNRWQAFHPFASFEDVPSKFLLDDGKIDLQVISPRCFEAACLGTVLVMYPGEYSGLLKEGVHYIPLNKDFSNFEEVLSKINDLSYLQEIADNAQNELVTNTKYSYKNFIVGFDEQIIQLAASKSLHGNEQRPNLLQIDSNLGELKKPTEQNIKSGIYLYGRFLWRSLPQWIKFFLSVTILRKRVYFHLFR